MTKNGKKLKNGEGKKERKKERRREIKDKKMERN